MKLDSLHEVKDPYDIDALLKKQEKKIDPHNIKPAERADKARTRKALKNLDSMDPYDVPDQYNLELNPEDDVLL